MKNRLYLVFTATILILLLGSTPVVLADVLKNGEALENLSGARDSEVSYSIDVGEKSLSLVVEIWGGQGDADLYVAFKREPDKSDFDCRPYEWGNKETCTFKPPEQGTYHIMLHGYDQYSGLSLKATYVPDSGGDPDPDPKCADGGEGPSDVQKELLTAHNKARSQGRSCGGVYYDAAPALTWNCKLGKAATKHTKDMVDNNFFSHTGSDGSSVSDRVRAQGYQYRTVGENIAAGYSSVEQVMDGWLKSPGHCANIMRSSYTELGAEKISTSTADYPHYWTSVFGAPQ
ncbi:CAP domain-containing protein [Hahella sp. HN01]|uniref:CAP domain-containing protein n=1 Tax=unclassified Hahella TaxID=2624107 RepID=UPI001C1EDE40|nr:CAP domain-containing protein [Hahella sp. HN01]MBU6952299.1 pre-peptidase C-terminal domain-containing protein [Hahella sp. HN01]